MNTLRAIADRIDRANDHLGLVIRWMALFMVLIGAVGAVLRYVARYAGWSLNLTPAIEAQWYMFSVIFLMGAAYGLQHDVHVRVDVLYERVGRRRQAMIDLIGTVIFLVPFSIMMLYVTFPAVRASIEVLEASPDPGGLPRWPIKSLILFSFVLLVLQGFSQVVKQIEILVETRGEGDDGTDAEPPTPESAPSPEAAS